MQSVYSLMWFPHEWAGPTLRWPTNKLRYGSFELWTWSDPSAASSVHRWSEEPALLALRSIVGIIGLILSWSVLPCVPVSLGADWRSTLSLYETGHCSPWSAFNVSFCSVIFAFELNNVAQKTISPFSACKNHVMCDQWTGDSRHVTVCWPNLFGPEQTNDGCETASNDGKFYK